MNYEGPSGREGKGDSAPRGEISIIEAQAGTIQVSPADALVLGADFVRQGPDLILTGADGQQIIGRDFFRLQNPADLITEGGQLIKAELAIKLAGPLAPGQYAQAAPAGAGDPIGKVVTAEGKVEANRADGTRVTLKEGDPVYQGDVLETGKDAALGIEFADETTFSLGDSGRMTLDEMIYDPGGDQNSMAVSLVQAQAVIATEEAAKAEAAALKAQTTISANNIATQAQTAETTAESRADDGVADASPLDALEAAADAATAAAAAKTAADGANTELSKPSPVQSVLDQFKADGISAAADALAASNAAQTAATTAANGIITAAQNLNLTFTPQTAAAATTAIKAAANAIINDADASSAAKALARDALDSADDALKAANAAQQDADAAAESLSNANAQSSVATAAADEGIDAVVLPRAKAAAADINAANETAETAAKSAEASRDAAVTSGDEALAFARDAMAAMNSTLDSAADFETTNGSTAADKVQDAAAFCLGYLRGLSFIGPFAVVGLSKPRENKTFSGLPLDDALAERNAEAQCALYVIDTRTGDAVHWLKMDGIVQELYDVSVIPGARRPMAFGFKSDEIRRTLNVGEQGTL